MRVALFQPQNIFACWYSVGGYVRALERMGHEVLEVKFPGNTVSAAEVEKLKSKIPTIGQLNEYDVVLSAYHEYAQPWLSAIYRKEQWDRLKVPVIARFDESMNRQDLHLPKRVPELLAWADYYSFPAKQDAAAYGGTWTPYGADVWMFNGGRRLFDLEMRKPLCQGCGRPMNDDPHWACAARIIEKKYQVAFIGTHYGPRKAYLDQLVPQLPDGVEFTGGNVWSQDLSGILGEESMKLLAKNYREIKVFFCLPGLSHLILEKVVDIMACGTFVMYPHLPGNAEENLEQFEDGKEIVYYDAGYIPQNVKAIKYWLDNEAEREAIARAGCERVHRDYTIEKMLDASLSTAGVTQMPAGSRVVN